MSSLLAATFKPEFCRIAVLGPKNDDALAALGKLPAQAEVVAIGANLDELKSASDSFATANVLLVMPVSGKFLTEVINSLPNLVWVHTPSSGVDHIRCAALFDNTNLVLTNAKGVYSSSLAEYALFGCNYFAKNTPRWLKQQKEHHWEKFTVKELRGATMGIVGYGSIGQATAVLARAYGMKVIALRRNPEQSSADPNVEKVYGPEQLGELMQLSDYVVVSLALTDETRNMVRAEHFAQAKKGQVLVNVGRGPVLDEQALIAALQNGQLAAAVLDVTTVEPLPKDSPLWDLPNVLISPHNGNQVEFFRHSSVTFFTENVRKFVGGQPLECVVDKITGY